MNRSDLVHALTYAGIRHQVEPGHVFVDFLDAPEATPKGLVVHRLVHKLAQLARVDIADKGVVFLV
jgi:hypothetical protein